MPIPENDSPYLQLLKGVSQLINEGIELHTEKMGIMSPPPTLTPEELSSWESELTEAGYTRRSDEVHAKLQLALSRVPLIEEVRDSLVRVDSAGNVFVTVPDVIGSTLVAATSALEALGLTVVSSEWYDETQELGIVGFQDHPAGTEISSASTVRIRVRVVEPVEEPA